jgi:hypothetical protein
VLELSKPIADTRLVAPDERLERRRIFGGHDACCELLIALPHPGDADPLRRRARARTSISRRELPQPEVCDADDERYRPTPMSAKGMPTSS